jgi:hypothetical protein
LISWEVSAAGSEGSISWEVSAAGSEGSISWEVSVGGFGRIDLLGGFGVGGFGAGGFGSAVGAGLTGAKQADLGGGTLGVLFASRTR